MSFDTLGLCPELLANLSQIAYTKPSPIQLAAIPAVLSRRDVMAVAQTGTGKTAAFSLPMLHILFANKGHTHTKVSARCVRALIITPTRELAAQVEQSIQGYAANMALSCTAVFGGVRIEPQIACLREGVDVLVATPGRLMDLYKQVAIDFSQLEILVLDEADRMLDLGFVDDIRAIQALLPSKRQTLMFSATFSKPIKRLANSMLHHAQIIELEKSKDTHDKVQQQLYHVDKARKSDALIHLIKSESWQQVLVFTRTKNGADSVVLALKKAGISAESIHANRTQHARTLALSGFKDGTIASLVATDIASRGIDVNQLPCVVNYDLPYVAEDYIHRIGRTGRAGRQGLAVSLFSDDESKQLNAVERLSKSKFTKLIIPGFAPSQAPASAPVKAAKQSSVSDDDLYGNFEPDPKNTGRKPSSGKGKRRRF